MKFEKFKEYISLQDEAHEHIIASIRRYNEFTKDTIDIDELEFQCYYFHIMEYPDGMFEIEVIETGETFMIPSQFFDEEFEPDLTKVQKIHREIEVIECELNEIKIQLISANHKLSDIMKDQGRLNEYANKYGASYDSDMLYKLYEETATERDRLFDFSERLKIELEEKRKELKEVS